LENGQRIKVLESKFQGIGIDTQEDLDAINTLFTRMGTAKD
jgi:3-deoxy-manno-octulosonate cytidylyltransferase (CMP-KDO synthetase)